MKNLGQGKLRTGLVCLALALGTALLYAPVLNFSFVSLDDPLYLDNHIKRGLSWASLRWCFTTTTGYLWHPLTWVSQMLDCQFFDGNMGWHHVTSVVLHILSTLVLFLVLNGLTRAFWRSAMVAALFAWHPLHVESVAWIAERKDVLSALFWMLTLWAYFRYAEEDKKPEAGPAPAKHRRALLYILALLFFVLGLMAKPMLVTMPFVLLLLDWWPLRRFQCNTGPPSPSHKPPAALPCKSLLIEKIPFFFFCLLFSVLTVAAVGPHAATLAALPLSQRMITSVLNYFIYVAKTIWPGHMVVLYPFQFNWPAWEIAGACLFIAAVSLIAFRLGKSRPYLLFGWLWYLGILVPVIGLVQVGTQTIADRYTYIPSIGLFIIACWGACDLFGRWRHGALLLAGLGWAVLLTCGLVAGHQLQYWQNSESLFGHNLQVAPDNYFAHADFAGYLYDEHELDRAMAESQKSIAQKPDFAFSHTILGGSLFQRGKVNEAIEQFVIALRIDPSSVNARLGYAKALMAQEEPDEAAQQIAIALGADPDNPEAHCLLGKVMLTKGNLDEAGRQFAKSASLVETYPDAQIELALVLARQGKTEEALKNYRAGNNVPTNALESLLLNNLAWILAASPFVENRDGPTAVALATRARDLDHARHPVIIGTLAAAYAEAGRFDDAMAAAQQAHDLALALAAKASDPAEKKADEELAARNLELLELYRSHKPYHETLTFKN